MRKILLKLLLVTLALPELLFIEFQGAGGSPFRVSSFYLLMMLSVVFFPLVFRYKRHFRWLLNNHYLIIVLIMLVLIGISFFVVGGGRASATLHFIFYLYSYLLISSLMRAVDEVDIVETLVFIIYFYFYTLLFFYLINMLSYADYFSFAYSLKDGHNRVDAFATEPSYAAIFITLAYFRVKISEKVASFKRLDMAVVLSILMLESAYGYLLLGLILIVVFKKKKILSVGILGLLLLIYQPGLFDVSRITNIANNFSNVEQWGTAAIRVIPFIDMFNSMAAGFKISSFIGHGPGASSIYFHELYYKVLTDNASFGAGLPGFLYDFGIIAILTYCIYIYKQSFKFPLVSLVIFIIVFLNAGISTQLCLWTLIILTGHVGRTTFQQGHIMSNVKVEAKVEK